MKKMKSFLCVFLLCFGTFCAQAQTPIATRPIAYARSVPAFARRMMPVEAKSVFWGQLAAQPDLAATGFHLYALYAPELKKEGATSFHFALDSYRMTPQPQLLNRVFLQFSSSWKPTHYGMYFSWLNPQTKTLPLIVIRVFSVGDYGPIGSEYFVAMPGGWTNLPSIAELGFGKWHASDTSGEDNSLLLGENGFAEIRASLGTTTSELSPEDVERNYNFTVDWEPLNKQWIAHAQNADVLERYYTATSVNLPRLGPVIMRPQIQVNP